MSEDRNTIRKQRLIDAFTMFVVGTASISLLIYVAFGEAKRTYDQFMGEKMAGEASLLRDSIEASLRAGLPIRQFAGFGSILDNALESDRSLSGISIRDNAGVIIFELGDVPAVKPKLEKLNGADAPVVDHTNDRTIVMTGLRSRFEQVAVLTINMRRDKIDQHVAKAFLPCLIVGGVAAVLFSIFSYLASSAERAVVYRRTSIVYAGVYMTVAAVVISVLLSLYSDGAQARARAAAETLAGRLDDVLIFKLDYSQFEGIDSALVEFKKINKDVSALSIVTDGRVAYDADPTRVGATWFADTGMQVISLRLSPEDSPSTTNLVIEIPSSLVIWEIARSAKNFLALFISSGFLAILFMELGRTLREAAQHRPVAAENVGEDSQALATILVKPAYFLAVFADSLAYPFLPQFSQRLAAAQGVSAGFASTPFMAYYACFALALVPAERLERRFGPRTLMITGMVLCLTSYVLLTLNPSFSSLFLARAIAGLGQGVMFIGVQSYVLNHVRVTRRTQAAGIIVFGFQAGTMAGMAIGSLLVNELGVTGVWVLSGSIAGLACLYLLGAVPDLRSTPAPSLVQRSQSVWRDLATILRDSQFIRSMAFVGVPAKAIMTGVVLFATPILLNQSGFAQEEVGQMTMIYAGAVVLVSHLASRFVDNTGSVENVLFTGAICSGVGLALLGVSGISQLMGDTPSNVFATVGMIVGLATLGAAHGLINAPIITYVANAPVATKLGAASVAATYRLLERVGHVAGPIVMSQIFLFSSQSWSALCWVAAGTVALGVFFIATGRSSSSSGYHAESVQ